ncbi:RusA family crossover junction endodeoxyribonuclease [Companilactobacillus zhachilii]|uniref:RusA family crossover junction endodeoxyribonuclease n=1 Tax=Companilactobacillus zhachilii TaxID=2304606 RepID=UPI00403430EE
MSKELIMTVDDEPVAAARPRVTRWGTYIAEPYKSYKKYIEALYAEKYHNEQLFDRGIPLVAHIHFYRPIQKGLSKKEYLRRANHEVKPAIKPDLDNYEKAIYDGLKKAWFDDGQIVKHETEKDYDENPRTEIEVRKWTK